MRICGFTVTTTGKNIPVLSMNSFINTVEGNNLYAKCQRMGDMMPYRVAKAKWKIENAEALAQEREITLEQLHDWKPEYAEGMPYIGPEKAKLAV